MNETVSLAIKSAVKSANQPDDVATQLVKWLEAVAEGSESLEDAEAVSRRCEFLYMSTQVEEGGDD